MSLLDRQLDFVDALRGAGLSISVAEGLDAVSALAVVDVLDREQLRAGLAAALVKRPAHRPTFDFVFDVFYPPVIGASVAPPSATEPPSRAHDAAPRGPNDDPVRDRLRADVADSLRDGDEVRMARLARDAVAAFGAVPGSASGTSSWSGLAVLNRVSPQTLMAQVLDAMLGGTVRGGRAERHARVTVERRVRRFAQQVDADVRRRMAEETDAATVVRRTARPTLDRVGFIGAGRQDLIDLRREIQPLARRLASRLALDRRRAARGQLDFRRTMRSSLSTGGVPLAPQYRPRRPVKTELVVLCDLSESVTSFAHFTLLLVYALREQFSRVRAFAFVDELDEITRFFTPGVDPLVAVTTLTREADVTGLFGRTDYGTAFELFAHRFPGVVGPRSSLLVLGDARSNYGDLALPVLTDLAVQARNAHWLNPERRGIWDTGDSRAAEFGAIVPMVECRNLVQLGEFVRGLAS